MRCAVLGLDDLCCKAASDVFSPLAAVLWDGNLNYLRIHNRGLESDEKQKVEFIRDSGLKAHLSFGVLFDYH